MRVARYSVCCIGLRKMHKNGARNNLSLRARRQTALELHTQSKLNFAWRIAARNLR
jgi:hypothetical protein